MADLTGWGADDSAVPRPPMNGVATSPYVIGMWDLRWDDPSLIGSNSGFVVVGVNVYRSEGSDRGPYRRLNEFPVGGGFYRDSSASEYVDRELVAWDGVSGASEAKGTGAWDSRGGAFVANNRRWVFRTGHAIVKRVPLPPYDQPTWGNSVSDVTVYVNGVEVGVAAVFGQTGEVTLVNVPTWNAATERYDDLGLPTSADDVVEVSYYRSRGHVASGLGVEVFYRLATVVVSEDGGYRDTPLEYCPVVSPMAIEALDYIWREAIRRNYWILQQGGERVKVFVRKVSGLYCACSMDERTREYGGQPSNRCRVCYGTGFVGGYEGPYDTIVAPDDAERRISQGVMGRRKEHSYEVWTIPSPIVTQRDFIVKQDNTRYSVGPVRRPSNRGNVLQQHFTIAAFDEADIRYAVPIDGTDAAVWPQTRYSLPSAVPMPIDGDLPIAPPYANGPDAPVGQAVNPVGRTGGGDGTPMGTDAAGWGATQPRGRTPAWANINTK